ncbi:hypothetical protein HAX54_033044 [Datura stramonium]|uniref:Uncharacterized protein n=1 Tax=Datura stramonium TaxID=4076 RepID=A0ABS8SD38_DATST|nr:hypothetical protein [Datura stramonium]
MPAEGGGLCPEVDNVGVNCEIAHCADDRLIHKRKRLHPHSVNVLFEWNHLRFYSFTELGSFCRLLESTEIAHDLKIAGSNPVPPNQWNIVHRDRRPVPTGLQNGASVQSKYGTSYEMVACQNNDFEQRLKERNNKSLSLFVSSFSHLQLL